MLIVIEKARQEERFELVRNKLEDIKVAIEEKRKIVLGLLLSEAYHELKEQSLERALLFKEVVTDNIRLIEKGRVSVRGKRWRNN